METRQQIQVVALEMFMAQGYDGTSMDAIADAVGITKPAVYYHFESKQALFTGLLEGLFEGIVSQYLAVLGQLPTVREVVTGLFAMTVEMDEAFGDESGSFDLGYVALLLDAARRFPDDVCGRMDRFYTETRDLIAERVVEGQETGEIRADVDPAAFSLACVALVEGTLLVGALAPSCDFVDGHTEIAEILYRGIAAETE